ncbi:MAG: insulinase family protein [Opitutaceae bacterium]|nr:insulinase family protein [Opitutaceae bacterium]
MKFRILFLGLFLLAPLAAADFSLENLPPRPQAPNDQSAYRRLVLDNGLRVILLSDPKLNTSAASLVVHAGQIDDPDDRPGLAHFLEHMLFLGTEKYPDVSDYGNYLTSNGGYSNAYTASDHTNYQFEIAHETFEGAIDRFAQFFIAPLFTPEFTEREISAVNNEAAIYRENDGRRLWQVKRELYAPDSSERKFSTGNRVTLEGTTQEELLAFYRQHYSADRMALALIGRATLDQLEAWAREYFSAIPRHELPPIVREQKFLPPLPALRLAQIEPVKEVRQLALEFALGPTRPDFAAKPAELLGHLIGHEGAGSLLAYLKAQGWALGLGAGAYERTTGYGSFLINIDLTPQGLEQKHEVLAAVFAYVRMLQNSPYPEAFFHERAAMARLDELYRDKGDGADRAVGLANNALFHPLEIAEREAFLWLKPDEDAYRRVLNHLRPDNLLVALTAKGLPTDRKEQYYDIPYSYTEDRGPAYTALTNPPAIAALHLPKPNPFTPRQTELLALHPVRVIDEPGLSLYYLQDTEFARPMSAYVYKLRPAAALADLEGAVLLRYYVACLTESISELLQDAQLAGITCKINRVGDGLFLSVGGYSDSAARFLDALGGRLIGFELDEERFAALKDGILRTLASFPVSETYQIAQERKRFLALEHHIMVDEQLERARTVTLAEVRDFARRFYARGKLEGLAHGNLTAEDAVRSTRALQARLGTQPLPPEDTWEMRYIRYQPGETVVDAERVAGNNSCLWHEYLFPADTPEYRAAAMVLGNFVNEPFYAEMRTRQQLGYLVWGGTSAVSRQLFAYFVIQSSEYAPDELRTRAFTFLATLGEQWATVDAEKFAALVAGVRSSLLEKDKTIEDRAVALFDRAYPLRGDWERNVTTLAALEQLTPKRVGEILAELVAPETQRARTILLTGREHQTKGEITPTFTDRATWKKTRTFE